MKKMYIYGEKEKRRNYVEALETAGATVIVSLSPGDAEECDGLLLPGGGDIDPAIYGEDNMGSVGIDRSLDDIELSLIKQFSESNRPILGICRGAQLLNVAFYGSLIQDLPFAAAHRWEESTGDKRHLVEASQGSFLREIYGVQFPVNSAHHQGAGRVAGGFQVAAKAADGGIEALQWPQRRIYAVQWHPERMTLRLRREDTVDGIEIFRFFMGLF